MHGWTNSDGWIFWYNKRWYEYTGTAPEQMEGWGWQSVHDPQELPKVMQNWQKSIETGQPFEMTFPLKGADNIFRPFLTRVAPVRESKGNIERWFGANTDITQEKVIQETLEELGAVQRQFKSTFEQAAVGIAHVSEDGKFLLLNQTYCKILAYTESELIKLSFKDITYPDDINIDVDLYKKLKAREIPYYHLEKRYIKKDGGILWVNLTASIVWDEKGNFE